MVNEELQQLLLDYLDDELDEGERSRVESVLASDAEARRFVDEHRAVWSALGEAYAEPAAVGLHDDPAPDAAFREQTVARARRAAVIQQLTRWTPRLAAAAALLVAVLFGWQRFGPSDREVVRHLHMLERVGFLQIYGEQLDLQSDIWIFKAFDGEVDEDA